MKETKFKVSLEKKSHEDEWSTVHKIVGAALGTDILERHYQGVDTSPINEDLGSWRGRGKMIGIQMVVYGSGRRERTVFKRVMVDKNNEIDLEKVKAKFDELAAIAKQRAEVVDANRAKADIAREFTNELGHEVRFLGSVNDRNKFQMSIPFDSKDDLTAAIARLLEKLQKGEN